MYIAEIEQLHKSDKREDVQKTNSSYTQKTRNPEMKLENRQYFQ